MKRTRRRILRFSACASLAAIGLVGLVLVVFEAALPFRRMGEVAQQSLAKVRCSDAERATPGEFGGIRCDAREIENDWDFEPANYILAKDTRFFLLGSSQYRGFWLNASDPSLISQFREPSSWRTPGNEVWRLYSQAKRIGGTEVEIMVGHREKASWLLQDALATSETDGKLREEAERIAARVRMRDGKVESPAVNSNVDGYEIVEAATGRVIRWNGQIPAILPSAQALPRSGVRFYRDGTDLYLVRVDENDDLVAVTIGFIGNGRWLGGGIVTVGIVTFIGVYLVCTEWMKRYFVIRGGRPTGLKEALVRGEDQAVEFKHGVVDHQLLRAVTAFANTNDGTVFIGVDDKAKVQGLPLASVEAKDGFRHRIYSLVREKIRPIPVLDLEFEEVEGVVVARVFVPRGDEPLYYYEGVPYIRHGESNVTPRPEQITRLLAEYSM